jgi:regulator of RNase E activity RraA
VLPPEKKLVGRALTVQFISTPHHMAVVMAESARERGLNRTADRTAIARLDSGDVAVIDLFAKLESGSLVRNELVSYTTEATGDRAAVDGAHFYVLRIQETGMPAYVAGCPAPGRAGCSPA